MTAQVQNRLVGPRSHQPALSRCVAGDLAAFGSGIWGQQPWLSRAEELPRDFSDLLSAQAVDELVSSRGLRAPFVRVAKDGATLPDKAFTSGGGVGAAIADQVSDDKLLRLFADGATIVLQGLHRTWPPLLRFSQQLAAELGHPVQVNAYVTPPQNQGFSAHYDTHDVFVLQTQGEKRWRIHEPVLRSPLRDQVGTDRRTGVATAAEEPPLLDVGLRQGDCLYLPRGYLHSATALGEVSVHLTVGVHSWTRHALAQSLVSAAMRRLSEDEAVRQSLPLGVDVGGPAQLSEDLAIVRERLLAVMRDVSADTVAEWMTERARDAQRAAPVAPLAQLAAAEAVGEESVVALRPHLAARLQTLADGRTVLSSRAGQMPVSFEERAAVTRLLDGGPVRVRDLPGPEGDARALVRRLLMAGVLLDTTATRAP